jgi:hypothetical protein
MHSQTNLHYRVDLEIPKISTIFSFFSIDIILYGRSHQGSGGCIGTVCRIEINTGISLEEGSDIENETQTLAGFRRLAKARAKV